MENLRKYRKQHNILQKELASQLGVAVSTFSGWESGTYEIDYKNLIKLSNILKVSVDFLLDISSKETELFNDARTSLNPVLEMYNQLTPHQQELIIERMQGFIDGNAERQQQYNRQSAENRATVKYFKAQNTDY